MIIHYIRGRRIRIVEGEDEDDDADTETSLASW